MGCYGVLLGRRASLDCHRGCTSRLQRRHTRLHHSTPTEKNEYSQRSAERTQTAHPTMTDDTTKKDNAIYRHTHTYTYTHKKNTTRTAPVHPAPAAYNHRNRRQTAPPSACRTPKPRRLRMGRASWDTSTTPPHSFSASLNIDRFNVEELLVGSSGARVGGAGPTQGTQRFWPPELRKKGINKKERRMS